MRYRFHLIPNAHLDPVWLWDFREGLNEGITTCRTILDLMDDDPELTFIRGESAIYQHIERHDPATFARITAMVEAGRWDIVGGSYIQPDTNLPASETFLRHYAVGTHYFRTHFGKTPRIGWAADSFGHSGGLPDLLQACGIEGYAFTRPFAGNSSAFWWEGVGGGRVLAYRPPTGWYGAERDEMPRRLDSLLKAAETAGFVNVGVFFGIGNHGGGPTRRQLAEIRAWVAAHSDQAELVYSGLHRLFDDLKAEIAGRELPVHRGELNYCLRGCYASVAKFKFLYRKAEAALGRAETIASATAVALGGGAAPLSEPWETLLFNSFHDILPGTSLERAFDDQLAQIGGVIHAAQRAELTAVNALALLADTSVPHPDGDMPSSVPFLVVNPHSTPFDGTIELEAGLDYRPLWAYRNRPDVVPAVVRAPDGAIAPAQRLAVENLFGVTSLPWRARALVPVSLPPLGWAVYTLGLETETPPSPTGTASATDNTIMNGTQQLSAGPGDTGLQWTVGGATRHISAITVEDPYGSWGAMDEAPESLQLNTVRHHWTVEKVQVLESGPLRASLWVRLTGGSSWLELTCSLTDGNPALTIVGRVLWNERSARLKLCIPGGGDAQFDVPGGVVTRPAGAGEVPGGRWVRTESLTFASDSLYNFEVSDALRATICRASRYAADDAAAPDVAPWQPAVDAGELRFRLLVGERDLPIEALARTLERPPLVQTVAPSPGPLGRHGTLLALSDPAFVLTVLKPAEDGDGWVLHATNTTTTEKALAVTVGGSTSNALPVAAGTPVFARWRNGQLSPTDAREA